MREITLPPKSEDDLYSNIWTEQLRHARFHGFRVYAGPAAVRRTVRRHQEAPKQDRGETEEDSVSRNDEKTEGDN